MLSGAVAVAFPSLTDDIAFVVNLIPIVLFHSKAVIAQSFCGLPSQAPFNSGSRSPFASVGKYTWLPFECQPGKVPFSSW